MIKYKDIISSATVMGMFYGSQLQAMLPKLHSDHFEGMELIRPMYCIHEDDIIAWRRRFQAAGDQDPAPPPRPSQILCKPPMWCRIEAPHRRFYIWPERIVLQKKTPGGRKCRSRNFLRHVQKRRGVPQRVHLRTELP